MMENTRQAFAGVRGTNAADDAAIADLRHQFRNQIQTMTSLVGLFGARMEPGPARAAFVDLRARLEATAVMHADEFASGDQMRCDAMLAALARRIAALYESGRRMTLDIDASSFMVEPKRAGTIAQLFAEMLIEFFRAETSPPYRGVAAVMIAGDEDGALSLKVSGACAPPAQRLDDVSALGNVILESLAQSLGGEVLRDRSAGFAIAMEAPGGSPTDRPPKLT